MPCNIQQGAKYTEHTISLIKMLILLYQTCAISNQNSARSIFRFRLIIGPTTRWVVHTYSYSKTIIMINHDNHC